jgi:hypothetical protein
MVARDKAAGSVVKRSRPPGAEFTRFEVLLKGLISVPPDAVAQAEKEWGKGAAARRKKRRGRAEE